MNSKWMVYAKKADFKQIASEYGIDQVLARIIRNRDICGSKDIDKPEYYLLLTNGFLELTNIRYAIDTLEFAETRCKSNEIIQLFLEKCKSEIR